MSPAHRSGGAQGSFAASSYLPDQDRVGYSLAPALRLDMARMFRQLGVQQMRAAVADTTSKASQVAWSLSDVGQLNVPTGDLNLDSVFPGASAIINGLEFGAPDKTHVQKMSPRLWNFAWRVDASYAVVAEIQYREKRDSVSDTDAALVRLVCSAVIRVSQPSGGPAAVGAAHAVLWPAVERRAFVTSPRSAWMAFWLNALGAVLSAWLAMVAVPQLGRSLQSQQEQLDRMRKGTDATLVGGLSQALGTGDYGEVQQALVNYANLGFYDAAVVTNAGGKVVALVGQVPGQRIGDAVNPTFRNLSRTMGLAAGPDGNGRVLVTEATSANIGEARSKTRWHQAAAWLAVAVSTSLALTALWAVFRDWRLRPRKPS